MIISFKMLFSLLKAQAQGLAQHGIEDLHLDLSPINNCFLIELNLKTLSGAQTIFPCTQQIAITMDRLYHRMHQIVRD